MALPIAQLQGLVENPIHQALAGYEAGRQEAAQRQQVQAQQARNVEIQGALRGLFENPNVKAPDYARIITQFPELAQQLKAPLETFEKSEQEAMKNQALSVYTAVRGGNLEMGKQLLGQYSEAARNSGDEDRANLLDSLGSTLEDNPEAYKTQSGLLLSAIMGGDEFAAMMAKADELNAPAEGTSSQKDYQFYKQQESEAGRKPLTFNEWSLQGKKAGATSISIGGESAMGTIPPGFEVFENEEGRREMRPIIGGPADTGIAEAETKKTGRQASKARAAKTVVQDLGRSLERMPDMFQGEGIIGANSRAAMSKVKGSVEWQVQQFIESAKSNIGIDVLQTMRENSPTGGALGQVPFQQQQRLEQVLGSMNVEMLPQDLKDNMQRVMNIYMDIQHGTSAERAVLVEQGKITPEENQQIQGEYFELSFDEMGRTIESLIEQYGD